MKIALSCNGEGFGHVSRMVSFAEGLAHRYQLYFFAPSSVADFVRSKLPSAHIIEIPFLPMEKEEDRIHYLKTLLTNFQTVSKLFRDVHRIKDILKQYDIDACVSDYEPYLPLACRFSHIPVLQINHPGIVLKHPRLQIDALIAKLTSLAMMGPFDKRLYCSFYNGDVGLILREEIIHAKTSKEDFIVIYLKNEYQKRAVESLKRLGIENFVLFPDSKLDYVDHLRRAKAVITSAGHQSISECIYLNKPVLVLPQQGQYEQRLNAEMLRKSGRGDTCSLADLQEKLPQFLEELSSYPKKADSQIEFCFENQTQKVFSEIQRFLLACRYKKRVRSVELFKIAKS